MKRIILLTLLVMAGTMIIWSQVPQAMNYKAIAKDDWGVSLPNKTITLRFSILQGSGTGSIVYQETHTTTTNKFGLMDVKIGLGKPEGGVSFTSIDWSAGVYYIRIEMDPKGGTDFRLEDPAHQLLSVPYALYAGSAAGSFSGYYSDLIGAPFLSTVATSGSYFDLSDRPTHLSQFGNDLSFLTIETDPLFSVHPANGITTEKISNWNTAFLWGNHANEGYLKSFTESDPIFLLHPAHGIASDNISNWNDAYGWGNHANAEYLKSFTESDPIFLLHPAHGIASDNISNWSTAYSWGNHAGLYRPIGYVPAWTEITSKPTTLTGYGITDAMSSSHAANGITATDITNWNTALNWGNHSGLYRPISYVPAWSEIIDKPTFATVATSGSYNDLNNKPITDGSETKITAGTNVTITGVGTEADPYAISSTVGGSGSSHYIGKSYGGGKIFWLDATGQHGLIVSNNDLGEYTWGSNRRENKAVKDGINGGHANTERIIMFMESDLESPAALLCANYTGGNYADWYLPSKYELNLLYLADRITYWDNKYYWSSTEISRDEAWAQNLSSGSQETFNKIHEIFSVRAIRAF